jgi:Zn-dependent peptidase ImmA (M78 family)
LNYIQQAAKKLIKKHHTNDPLQICELENINVTIATLPQQIKGFYTKLFHLPFIFLNDRLSHYEKRVVCAHELGHYILHPTTNTLFVQENTLLATSKLEHEADLFAAHLLIPDNKQSLHQTMTAEQIAFEYEVTIELVKTKYGYRI